MEPITLPMVPVAGDMVWPDGWSMSGRLLKGDSFSALRIETLGMGPISSVAIGITLTGKARKARGGGTGYRCVITFLGDGEPDVTAHGWFFPARY